MKITAQNLGNGRCLATECNRKLTNKQRYRNQKFCSHFCYSKNKIGEKHSWGIKIGNALRGKPKTAKHNLNVSIALTGRKRPEISGEKHHFWKGENASYGSIHDWISRYAGPLKKCNKCGVNKKNIRYQWSNVSGLYKRDLSDYERLCIKCHRIKDRNKPRASLIFNKKRGCLRERTLGVI